MRPITRTTELKNLVCGRKKLEQYEINKSENIPDEFSLQQNYPNPFNPSTNLGYNLKEDTMVSIIVFDIIGKKVVELVNEYQSAGYKRVQWNAKNSGGMPVSPGVYIYTIKTGNFTDSKNEDEVNTKDVRRLGSSSFNQYNHLIKE